MGEKRKFMRLEDAVTVKYKVKGEPRAVSRCVCRDISTEGAHIFTDKQLEKGTLLELKIGFKRDIGQFSAVGEVVWQEEGAFRWGEKEYFDTGVRFIDINIYGRDKIAKYIYNERRGEGEDIARDQPHSPGNSPRADL